VSTTEGRQQSGGSKVIKKPFSRSKDLISKSELKCPVTERGPLIGTDPALSPYHKEHEGEVAVSQSQEFRSTETLSCRARGEPWKVDFPRTYDP